ncbi:MAG: hypothetical protein H6735_31035 [Alphaproteobacteria bacterium]|nr:hypothetical protein [Alphaproteobacteria bacterium]
MLGLWACADGPVGLRVTPDGTGPMVVVDWDAEPLPELPFPNDLATRPDPTSPTGLRLNISTEATTRSESEARAKLDELVGFGIYSPISVRFDHRLDLDEVLVRHPDDFHDPNAFADDAFYLIDVEPSSPTYLQPVALDVGHGRFPMDVVRTDRYFPNDPRSDSPSVLFELGDEDANGNGELDWGEDTDNDGILDIPNVWPPGGDPRDDMLTWYDLETDTLIVRPVVPLREQTRYAMVLTSRLVDLDGEPVRSPWPYVNHVRQTPALEPVLDALPAFDLSVDDVAFAWVFTTGRVTGDLVDLRRGFDGEGPFATFGDDWPAAVTEALQVQTGDLDPDSPYHLSVEKLVAPLIALDLFPAESADVLEASYASFSDQLVGGVFVTPYLLADRDDGGRDDSDEWWQLDPATGVVHAEPQRVPFTCVLPKRDPNATGPVPIALFGHGYGSSRFDLFGFVHAFNRMGMVGCAMDFAGHGPTLDPEDEALAQTVLGPSGLTPFLDQLRDSRYRDLNNDGVKDSGGDQWSADPFHTRDMVRQASVDWMQMVRALRRCGETEWTHTLELPTGPQQTSVGGVSCDWDGDGRPDLGGPDTKFYLVGGSLGGIDAAVAAAVMPELEAVSPIVPGGGTLDIGVRTEIGGAVEALIGRLLTPMFLGYPTDDGGLRVVQMVNSVTDMVEVEVATLPDIPSYGRLRIENLANGEVRQGLIPRDGRFRLSIPCDAMDATEKRVATGMPDTGPVEGVVYEIGGNDGLGDPLVITIFDATGERVAKLDTFETEQRIEGVTLRAGSPLVAVAHGDGHIRGSSDVRRLSSVLAAVLEPGDAIAYGPHWFLEPFPELGGEPRNVLMVPTPGDPIVNINTGIALARSAGLVEWRAIDDRYGTTVDRFLIDHRVVQGIAAVGPYTNGAGEPVLFDADDLDDGQDGLEAPSESPLRASRPTGTGLSALRLPYVSTTGQHGFSYPDPTLAFDINSFAINQIAGFLSSDGTELSDDRCLERGDCDWLPPFEEAP